MRSIGVATVSAWAAHTLAWVAGVGLAFIPFYQGQSVTASLPGEPGGEVTRFSSTLVETNGLYAMLLLLIPILLTGIALLAIQFPNRGQPGRKVLLWGLAVVFLGLCAVAMFSVGLFYVPAALALLVAACTDVRGQAADA